MSAFLFAGAGEVLCGGMRPGHPSGVLQRGRLENIPDSKPVLLYCIAIKELGLRRFWSMGSILVPVF